jgi:hypothetical protein
MLVDESIARILVWGGETFNKNLFQVFQKKIKNIYMIFAQNFKKFYKILKQFLVNIF